MIYILRTWQGPQKLFRAFFIFFNFFYFFDFFLIFSIFFARTVYITIQSDRVYIDIYIYIGIYRYRRFGHFLTHFAALSVTNTKQMVNIWTSRFEDLSLNCDLG